MGRHLLIALALASCSPPIAPAPATPCEAACARLAELGCEEAKPSPGGVACLVVCERAASQNVDLTCGGTVARATSCEAACGGM